ncbi:RESTRICTED TEV MOVEMENT 2 [Spatholobus suberectus]|nr:RESTRICTED TEV MOVEMENT 2 [Spatholobus suberectus]
MSTAQPTYEDLEAKYETEETPESILLRLHIPDGFTREHIGAKVKHQFRRVSVLGERLLGNNRRVRFKALYQVPEYYDINRSKGEIDGQTVIITIPTIPGKVPKEEPQPTQQEVPKEPTQETEPTPEDKTKGETKEEADHETSTPPKVTKESMHQNDQEKIPPKAPKEPTQEIEQTPEDKKEVESKEEVDYGALTSPKAVEESMHQKGKEEIPPKAPKEPTQETEPTPEDKINGETKEEADHETSTPPKVTKDDDQAKIVADDEVSKSIVESKEEVDYGTLTSPNAAKESMHQKGKEEIPPKAPEEPTLEDKTKGIPLKSVTTNDDQAKTVVDDQVPKSIGETKEKVDHETSTPPKAKIIVDDQVSKATVESKEEVDYGTLTSPKAVEESMHQKGKEEIPPKAPEEPKQEIEPTPEDKTKGTPRKSVTTSDNQAKTVVDDQVPKSTGETKNEADHETSTPLKVTKEYMHQKGQEDIPSKAPKEPTPEEKKEGHKESMHQQDEKEIPPKALEESTQEIEPTPEDKKEGTPPKFDTTSDDQAKIIADDQVSKSTVESKEEVDYGTLTSPKAAEESMHQKEKIVVDDQVSKSIVESKEEVDYGTLTSLKAAEEFVHQKGKEQILPKAPEEQTPEAKKKVTKESMHPKDQEEIHPKEPKEPTQQIEPTLEDKKEGTLPKCVTTSDDQEKIVADDEVSKSTVESKEEVDYGTLTSPKAAEKSMHQKDNEEICPKAPKEPTQELGPTLEDKKKGTPPKSITTSDDQEKVVVEDQVPKSTGETKEEADGETSTPLKVTKESKHQKGQEGIPPKAPKEPTQEIEPTLEDKKKSDYQEKTVIDDQVPKSTGETEEEVDHETLTPPKATKESIHQKGLEGIPPKDTEEFRPKKSQEEIPLKDKILKLESKNEVGFEASILLEDTEDFMHQMGQEAILPKATFTIDAKLQGEEKCVGEIDENEEKQKVIGKQEYIDHSKKTLEIRKPHEKVVGDDSPKKEGKEKSKGLGTFEGEKGSEINGKISSDDVEKQNDKKAMLESIVMTSIKDQEKTIDKIRFPNQQMRIKKRLIMGLQPHPRPRKSLCIKWVKKESPEKLQLPKLKVKNKLLQGEEKFVGKIYKNEEKQKVIGKKETEDNCNKTLKLGKSHEKTVVDDSPKKEGKEEIKGLGTFEGKKGREINGKIVGDNVEKKSDKKAMLESTTRTRINEWMLLLLKL